MGYIGNQTSNSFTSMDKQSIPGNGTTGPYTLTHAVANEQEIEVFVNNVRQEPGVAYTVSGNAITMTGNVAASDDFYVVFQGKAIQTTVPGDDTITTAMLKDGVVGTTQISDDAVTTAKIADNAVTAAQIASSVAFGITEVDQYRITQDFALADGAIVNNYWARIAGDGFEKIGTGVSESAGVFTVPSTGYWLVYITWSGKRTNAATDSMGMSLEYTSNNSSYSPAIEVLQGGSQNHRTSGSGMHLFKVTDTSNQKFRCAMSTVAGSGTELFGSADRIKTGITFIKIKDV